MRLPDLRRVALFIAMIVIALAAGCSAASEGLDESQAIQVGSGREIMLESEQVSILPEHVKCGVDNELFDPPEEIATRTVARLTQKGRDLGFSDDVTVKEVGFEMPYAQVRGTFQLEIRKVVNIKDANQGEKKVEAWAGVKINHACFPKTLTIMGVKRGSQNQTQPAAFLYALDNGNWRLDKILHQ